MRNIWIREIYIRETLLTILKGFLIIFKYVRFVSYLMKGIMKIVTFVQLHSMHWFRFERAAGRYKIKKKKKKKHTYISAIEEEHYLISNKHQKNIL